MLVMIMLIVGCGKNKLVIGECEYDRRDDEDLVCMEARAAEWLWLEGETQPGHVYSEDICEGKYNGVWVYEPATDSGIEEIDGKFLDYDNVVIVGSQVRSYTCYYSMVK